MFDVRIDRCRTIWDPTESVATKPLCMDLFTNTSVLASVRCYAVHDANKQQKSAKGKRLRRPTAILKHLRGLTSRGARRGMPRRSGNCHVSALVAGSTLVAGYRYAPFGAVVQAVGACAAINPFRFSSEYADDELGLVYYNYRHYNPRDGRWVNRDPIEEQGGWNLYGFVRNTCMNNFDLVGLVVFTKDPNAAGVKCTASCVMVIVDTFMASQNTGVPLECVTEHEEQHRKDAKEHGNWCTKDKNGCCNAPPNSFLDSSGYQNQPPARGSNFNWSNAWGEGRAYQKTLECCKRLKDAKCVQHARDVLNQLRPDKLPPDWTPNDPKIPSGWKPPVTDHLPY